MTDRVVITNQKTGAIEIKQLGYFLPVYDIGDLVAYPAPKDPRKEDEPEKFNESHIIGIQADIQKLSTGEVISAYIYQLDDETEVLEEEIAYYYPSEDLEDVEEEDIDPTALQDDERDPQGDAT